MPGVEREAKRAGDLLVAELEHVDVDLLEDWLQIAFVVVAVLIRVPHLYPVDTTAFLIVWTLPFDPEPWVILRWLTEAEKALLPFFFWCCYPACDVHLRDIIAR